MARPWKTTLLARTAIGSITLLGGVAHALPGAPVNIAVNPGGGAPVLTTPDAATLNIKFNAARTVLQYNGFDVAAGEAVNLRFDARSDIGVIHNVGEGAINIDGALRSFVGTQTGGNVWLLSSSGVFFGANARVDVGGLLASTAVPSNLLSTNGGVLDTTTLSFDFANGSGQVSIAAGARITGHGGTLAFIAPSVVSFGGSTVSGDGGTSVLYGGAQAYTVRFVREASDDLDLLDFEVPGLTAGSSDSQPLNIGGTTSAGNVYLASVGKAQTIASVLRADGDITATSAGLEGGTIVLTSGGGIANRAAAPVFTDGFYRQNIDSSGQFDAARDITANATGDVGIFGNARAAGSIKLTGLNIYTSDLTAGLDVVLHAGDPLGSTATGYGYGYGYGYSASGGSIDIFRITAGRDVSATTWNGNVGVNEIVLAGMAPDGSASGSLLLQTTGDYGDIYLGRDPNNGDRGVAANALTGGADTRLDGVGYVQVRSSGPVALTSIRGGNSVDISVDGALGVGTITTAGYVFAESLQSVAIGSATTTADGNGNGQIVLYGGTGASIATTNAATDLIVVTDHGDAIAGTVTAGDDVVLRATLGNAVLTSATITGGADTDGNFVNRGEGGFTFFDTSPDNAGYGHFIDLSATRTDPNQLLPDSGGDVRLGLATGTIAGYDGVVLNAEQDVAVNLAGSATAIVVSAGRDATVLASSSLGVDSLFAGNNALVSSSAGDAAVGYGTANFDLSILAPLGLASLSQGAVGGSFRLDGRIVDLGQLSGSDGGSPENVTIRTTAGDFDYFGLSANNDLILDISGTVDVASLSAGRDIVVTAGGDASIGQTGEGGGFVDAGRDLFLTAASLDIGALLSAGRDLSLTTTVADLDVGNQQFDAGQDIRLISAGLLTAGTVDAVRDLFLDGASVDAVQVSAGRNASVVARTGDAVIAGAAAGQDLSVLAALGLASVGDARVGQDFVLSGATASLGSLAPYVVSDGETPFVMPTRDLTVTTTAGDFVANGALTLTRDARFDIAGTLTLVQVDAGGDLVARAGSIDLGSATAGDDIRLGGGTINVSSLSTSGLGDSEADGSNIVATGTDIRIDSASAVGDIMATALGSLTLGQGEGSIAAGRDLFASGGTLMLGSLYAGRDLSLIATASGIDADNLSAVRDLSIDAAGALTFGNLGAGRDLRLAGASVDGGNTDAGNAVSVTGRSGAVNIGDISAGSDATIVALAGDAAVGNAAVSRDLSITAAAGLASVGNAQVGQDVVLSGASASLHSLGPYSPPDGYGVLVPTRDLTVTTTTGDFVATGPLILTRDARFDVAGTLTLAQVDAGGDLVARAGSISLGSATAGDDIRLNGATIDASSLSASGLGGDSEADGSNIVATGTDIRIDSASAVGDISATALNSLTLGQGEGSIAAGRDLSLIATASGIDAGSLSAGRDLTVDATGALSFGNLAAGRDLTLAGASVAGGSSNAGGALSIAGRSGAIDIGDISVGSDATILAQAGNAIVGDAAVARDLSVTAALGLASVGNARVGQDFRLTGATVQLVSLDGYATQSEGGGSFTPTRDAFITATVGGLTGAPDLSVSRDIVIAVGGAAALGTLSAGNDVVVQSGGTLTLAGLAAGRDVALGGSGIAASGGITAGRDATLVSSGGIAASSVTSGDDLRLSASGAVTVVQLTAPTSITATGGGAVSIGQAVSSGDVTVSGATVGGALLLSGRDIAVSSGGALTAGAGLNATRDLRLTAGTTLGFTRLDAARDLILTAATVQGGSAVAARDLTVIATTRIGGDLYQAGRTLLLDPDEVISATTVRAGSDATLIGASVNVGTLEVGGTTLVQATAGGIGLDTFTSGGAATLFATGGVALGAATTPALRIVAGDLDVRRSLVAASLQVETPGGMIVGGNAVAGETGFRLAAADIARIRVAGTTSFYAGLTATVTQPGGDLVLQDFAYDPANLPTLAFYADRSHVVDVQGRVLPSTTGGSIVIGDADPSGRFRPGSIYVSGGFGSADLVANCYGNIVAVGSLSLYSVNDVIFGASDFRTAIQTADAASIDLVGGSPAVPAGPADNRLFAVANRFVVDGAGKIVSQNTAADAGAYVGLFFNGLATSGPVISVGNARAIDLAGSLIDSAGELRSGQSVAFAGGLGGGSNGVVFRFNGCIVGANSCGSGTGASPAEALRLEDYLPPRPLDLLDEPLSTVLIFETTTDNLEVLTVGGGDDGLVIRRRKPTN